MPELDGRVCLVTGASRGLGAAVARRLAAAGARLVLTARTPGGLEESDDAVREASGARATLVPLDLAKHDEIDRLGAALHERFGRLDAVVHCAAELGVLTPAHHLDPKVWARVMAVNATATFRLIRSLDPLLRASDAGRFVAVTCAAARERKPFWGAYAASKAAMEAFVLAYAAEAARAPLRVNLVDPGPMRTRLRAGAYPGERPQSVPDANEAAALVDRLVAPSCAEHGALVKRP